MSEEDEFLSMGASGAEHLQGRTAGSRRRTEAGVVSAFWVLAVLTGGSRHVPSSAQVSAPCRPLLQGHPLHAHLPSLRLRGEGSIRSSAHYGSVTFACPLSGPCFYYRIVRVLCMFQTQSDA